jgi:signal transduction histidine kinase
MAVDLHDTAALLQRARRACVDMATVRAETLQTLAESRRLLTGVRSATASIALSPRIVADATDDLGERTAQGCRESDRLAAQLAAAKATARAVAHALNQPLAIIQGVTELIQTAPSDEVIAPDLAQIVDATYRAAAIIRDLARVARYTTQQAADGNPMLDLQAAIDRPALLE